MSAAVSTLPLILFLFVYTGVTSGSATRVLWLEIACLNSFSIYIRGGSYYGGVIKALVVSIFYISILLKIYRFVFCSGPPPSCICPWFALLFDVSTLSTSFSKSAYLTPLRMRKAAS